MELRGRVGRLTSGLLAVTLLAAPARAQWSFAWSDTLPFSGGNGQTYGDLVALAGGLTAVYSRPDLGGLRLFLYRYAADGQRILEREVGAPGEISYEPSLCWDGARLAVAASSYTKAGFLLLSLTGDPILPTTPLPSIPSGWRTAAFKVRCTPAGIAIFGLLLEPEFPGSSYFYTYLHYWRLGVAGQVQVDHDLGILLAPIAYPGLEGAEKEYYDVAWNGAGFLVAYSAECGTPPSFQSCYRVLDPAGDPVRAEAPATVTPTKGPHLAASGAVIGLATLRQNPFPGGNTLFARFFADDGTPLGPEQQYDDPARVPTGYAPTIVAVPAGFLAAYVWADPYTLDYRRMLVPFDTTGTALAPAAPVADPLAVLDDSPNLGIDLQLVAARGRLFARARPD
jgi:hypothetical protein